MIHPSVDETDNYNEMITIRNRAKTAKCRTRDSPWRKIARRAQFSLKGAGHFSFCDAQKRTGRREKENIVNRSANGVLICARLVALFNESAHSAPGSRYGPRQVHKTSVLRQSHAEVTALCDLPSEVHSKRA